MSAKTQADGKRRSEINGRGSAQTGGFAYRGLKEDSLKKIRGRRRIRDRRVHLDGCASTPMGELKNFKLPKLSCLIQSFFSTSF
jgi:hypothetical protein